MKINIINLLQVIRKNETLILVITGILLAVGYLILLSYRFDFSINNKKITRQKIQEKDLNKIHTIQSMKVEEISTLFYKRPKSVTTVKPVVQKPIIKKIDEENFSSHYNFVLVMTKNNQDYLVLKNLRTNNMLELSKKTKKSKEGETIIEYINEDSSKIYIRINGQKGFITK